MNPVVSVVIPAFNAASYLDHSIPSVLRQTFTDFELIVVNDGSTDDTEEKVLSFTDPRVRLVSQANRGLAGARNAGIRVATGDFVAFLDADDLWRPEKLERHVAHLSSRAEVGVSYSASAFIDENGADLHILQKPKTRHVEPRDVFLRNPVGNGSAPVIRRQALTSIAFDSPVGPVGEQWYFDERFRQSEDIECWLRIALSTSWKFEGLPQPLTYYRVNAGGLSAALEKQRNAWERVVERARSIAPLFVNLYEDQARAYQLRYLARRAVTMGEARQALRLLKQAIRLFPGMFVEEPARTTLTLGAALALSLLSSRAFRWSYETARRLTGTLQRLPRWA